MNLHQIWDSLVKVVANNSDPRITQRCDRQGNTYFHVYDPVSGRSSTFGSPEEIRFWLEERYYQ
jgi:hypothetical protein